MENETSFFSSKYRLNYTGYEKQKITCQNITCLFGSMLLYTRFDQEAVKKKQK